MLLNDQKFGKYHSSQITAVFVKYYFGIKALFKNYISFCTYYLESPKF